MGLLSIEGGGGYDCPEPQEPPPDIIVDGIVQVLFHPSALGELVFTTDDIDEGTVNKYITSGNVQDVGGVLNSTPNVSTYAWVIDENGLASSSNTQVPTQSSVKAYVDSQVATYTDVAAVALNTAKITNATHTGDVTGSTALTIGTDKVLTTHILAANVTNAKLADMAQNTFKGNDAVLGVPKDLTAAEARAVLNVEDGSTADQSNAEIETAYNVQVAIPTASEASSTSNVTIYRWSPSAIAQAVPGAAIAYGSINPHATTPTLDDNALNFSGVSRISTGQYYLLYSEWVTGACCPVVGFQDAVGTPYDVFVTNYDTSSVRVICKTTAGVVSDAVDKIHVSVFQHP